MGKGIHSSEEMIMTRYGLSAADCRKEIYKPGQILHHQGEPVEKIFLVVSGQVTILKSSSNGLSGAVCFGYTEGPIGALEIFLPNRVFDCSTVAKTELTALTVPIKTVDRMLESNTTFVRQMAADLALQLKNTHVILLNSQTRSASERLADYLLETAEEGLYKGTIQGAATATGVTYRHAWRLFQALLEEGILIREGKHYRIADSSALYKKTSVSG